VRVRYLAVLATTAVLASACGGGSSGTSSSSGSTAGTAAANAPVKIELLSVQQPTDIIPSNLQTLMTEFTKTHPGSSLKITFAAQADLDQKLQLLSAQGALPEMFYAPNTPAAQTQYAKNGQALNIEDTLTQLGVLDKVDPTAVKIMRSQQGGKMYALPFELNVEGFWYNKKIFADNAITPPATWDDLVKDADTFNTKGVQPFAASGVQGWPLTRLVSGYLYRELGPDALTKVVAGQAKLTDPPYVKAAQAVADLGAKGYFGKGFATLDYQPAEDVFLQGKAAMFYMGSWAVGDYNDSAKNKIGGPDNVGFFPFPTVAGGTGTAEQTPMNAGLPVMVSAKKYTPAIGAWLKYVVENYGTVALRDKGAISGFVASTTPTSLPATTQTVLTAIKATKDPLGWFEAPLSAKAGTISQKNAPSLVNGSKSAQDFMSLVQTAQAG
jgi:raffinose/stachyose/melibiose transport system substrate-binding protein